MRTATTTTRPFSPSGSVIQQRQLVLAERGITGLQVVGGQQSLAKPMSANATRFVGGPPAGIPQRQTRARPFNAFLDDPVSREWLVRASRLLSTHQKPEALLDVAKRPRARSESIHAEKLAASTVGDGRGHRVAKAARAHRRRVSRRRSAMADHTARTALTATSSRFIRTFMKPL